MKLSENEIRDRTRYLEDDGGKLKIYYGASDTSICVGTANVNELMQFCTIKNET